MTAIDTLSAGRVRLRLRPWRDQAGVVELSSTPAGIAVPPGLVHDAIERAHSRGYEAIVTPALPRPEWRPYLDVGFTIREHLELLAHDLLDLPLRMAVPTRRIPRRSRTSVLAIDHQAFPSFWRLDAGALDEAIRATPSVRFRRDVDGHAYALTGRAGDRGYIQRLAVDPAHQGHGLGAALVLDGLHWLRRWRVREALVNTQSDNVRAVALYERLGFRRRRPGLAVLEVHLGQDTRS